MGLLIDPYRFATASQTFADYAASLSPVGWWRLGESSGATAVAEFGPNGTYTGTPTLGATGLISGDADTCVNFDASGDYVAIPDDAAWDFTSCSFFAVIQTSSASLKQIICRDGANNSRSWQFRINSGKLNTIVINSSGTSVRQATSTGNVNDNTARTVIGTYDGTTGTVTNYINGAQDGQATGAAIALSTSLTNVVNIGRNPRSADGYVMPLIDEPMIFNRVLTSTEITELDALARGV